MPDYSMLSQKVKWLSVQDSLVQLARANGCFDHPSPAIEPAAMYEGDCLTRAFSRLKEANYFKKMFQGNQELHLHLSVEQDVQKRDCLIVEFFEAKYKPTLTTTLRSRTPVPLDILANYLPSMRLSHHVFEQRGKQTRDFMGKLGLVSESERNAGTNYIFTSREVREGNMVTEERFWRDMLETCAKVFPRGPSMPVKAPDAVAVAANAKRPVIVAPQAAQPAASQS